MLRKIHYFSLWHISSMAGSGWFFLPRRVLAPKKAAAPTGYNLCIICKNSEHLHPDEFLEPRQGKGDFAVSARIQYALALKAVSVYREEA